MRATIRLAISILVASLAVTGLSFAGTGSPTSSDTVPTLVDEAFTASDTTGTHAATADENESAPAGEPDERSRPVQFSTEECPDGFTGNHGEYVSSVPEDERRDAARSTCGKPLPATDRPSAGTEQAARPPHAGPPEGKGPAHAGPPADKRPAHAGPPEGKGPPHGRGRPPVDAE